MGTRQRVKLNAPAVKSTPPAREMGVGSHRDGIEMAPRHFLPSNRRWYDLPAFIAIVVFSHAASHAILRIVKFWRLPFHASISGVWRLFSPFLRAFLFLRTRVAILTKLEHPCSSLLVILGQSIDQLRHSVTDFSTLASVPIKVLFRSKTNNGNFFCTYIYVCSVRYVNNICVCMYYYYYYSTFPLFFRLKTILIMVISVVINGNFVTIIRGH